MDRKRPKFIFVGGVNGSGKTTILQSISKRNKKIGFLSGSSFFMKWLGIKKHDYTKLQLMPDKKIHKELKKMMQYVVKEKKFNKSKKVILVDAHFTNIINGKAIPWVDSWISLFDGLLLMEAKPKELLKRIKNDETRRLKKRDIFPINIKDKKKIKLLKLFNQKNELVFKKCVKINKKPGAKILNTNSDINKAIKKLTKFLLNVYEEKYRN